MAWKRGRSIYATPAWRALRLVVLTEANWRCSRCQRYANEVHHRDPLARRGSPAIPDRSGVLALCRLCHFSEHRSPERAAWDRLIAELRSPDTGTSATR